MNAQCKIKFRLPHQPPMLLVDNCIEKSEDSVVAYFETKPEHFYFQGHFPDKPVMPGVMMVESLAQASCLLADAEMTIATSDFFLAAIDQVRFSRVVVPGEVLTLHVKMLKTKRNFYWFEGIADIEGEQCCKANFTIYYKPKS